MADILHRQGCVTQNNFDNWIRMLQIKFCFFVLGFQKGIVSNSVKKMHILFELIYLHIWQAAHCTLHTGQCTLCTAPALANSLESERLQFIRHIEHGILHTTFYIFCFIITLHAVCSLCICSPNCTDGCILAAIRAAGQCSDSHSTAARWAGHWDIRTKLTAVTPTVIIYSNSKLSHILSAGTDTINNDSHCQ